MTTTVLPFVALLFLVLSVFMAMLVLARFLPGNRETVRVRERLERAAGRMVLVTEESAPRVRLRLKSWFVEQVGRIGEKIAPKDRETLTAQRVRFLQAGLRSAHAPLVFWGSRFVLVLVFVGLAFVMRFAVPLPAVKKLFALLAAGGGCLGYYLPELWLRSRTNNRKRTLLNELPDALDLLVVCVEAGMGLDQAIERVSHEVSVSAPEICRELQHLTLELRAGKKRHDALRNLSMRVGLDDVDSLVTLLIQADSFGTSVATTLRVYSETLRNKRFQRAEETAAKLPVKLLFPLVLFILPALFVVIIGPAALQLMDVFARINH
ncbi:Type II secretion system F domain-containing protein [Desulfovibrio sp. X2]|uniref:type II secretion system F family protein n=1 Tax=Desulfovibrio sp. X2 TaxID=941449 RepID=UPI000358C634|nr:type II secretion system F family protein [Desulfovibrio sp. X2]EPR44143.1 Type II secretion system F domain-containing protein [Desulfovibrio sp. X2]